MDERDDFKLLKAKLLRKILDRLDFGKLGQTPSATAQEQVLNFIRNLISDELTPLQSGKEAIDTKGGDARPPGRVEQLLNEWVKLARGKALAANGKIFDARDEILSVLQPQK